MESKDMHYVRSKAQKISKKPEDVLSPFILNNIANWNIGSIPIAPT